MVCQPRPCVYSPRPIIIGHRGCAALAPENTLASFRAALEAGAPAVECDVHCTSDGHVVVIHDATLDRTTDRRGAVASLTLEEVRQADAGFWKGEQYRGEHVPTLAEVLALTKGRARLIVEIKAEGIVPRVLETIRAADAVGEVTIVSFSLDTCREARLAEPLIPVGFLTGGLERNDEAEADKLIRMALRAHAQFLNVAHDGLTPALLRRGQLAGVSVWGVWTVNDPVRLLHLARMGVPAITTDDPQMGLRVLQEAGERSG